MMLENFCTLTKGYSNIKNGKKINCGKGSACNQVPEFRKKNLKKRAVTS